MAQHWTCAACSTQNWAHLAACRWCAAIPWPKPSAQKAKTKDQKAAVAQTRSRGQASAPEQQATAMGARDAPHEPPTASNGGPAASAGAAPEEPAVDATFGLQDVFVGMSASLLEARVQDRTRTLTAEGAATETGGVSSEAAPAVLVVDGEVMATKQVKAALLKATEVKEDLATRKSEFDLGAFLKKGYNGMLTKLKLRKDRLKACFSNSKLIDFGIY